MTCSCRGAMHVCAKAWEPMRQALGIARDELDAMMAPARVSQAALSLVLSQLSSALQVRAAATMSGQAPR